MTKEQYLKMKVGDKFRIKREPDKDRVVTLKDKPPFCKYKSADNLGFMVGTTFYRYRDCEVVSNE